MSILAPYVAAVRHASADALAKTALLTPLRGSLVVEAVFWSDGDTLAAPTPKITCQAPTPSHHHTLALAQARATIDPAITALLDACGALTAALGRTPAWQSQPTGAQMAVTLRRGPHRASAGARISAQPSVEAKAGPGYTPFAHPQFANLCHVAEEITGLGEGPVWRFRPYQGGDEYRIQARTPADALAWACVGINPRLLEHPDRCMLAQEHPDPAQVCRTIAHRLLYQPGAAP